MSMQMVANDSKKVIFANVPSELHRKVRKAAFENETSINKLVESILTEWVTEQERKAEQPEQK